MNPESLYPESLYPESRQSERQTIPEKNRRNPASLKRQPAVTRKASSSCAKDCVRHVRVESRAFELHLQASMSDLRRELELVASSVSKTT